MKNSTVQTTTKLLPDSSNVKVNHDDALRSRSSSKLEACEVRYGCCDSHPTYLQPLNNIIGFIVFVSLANCMQSLAQGLIGVVMSTIERHFDLSSSSSSWIASSYEIGQIPVLVVISLLGTRFVSQCSVRAPPTLVRFVVDLLYSLLFNYRQTTCVFVILLS